MKYFLELCCFWSTWPWSSTDAFICCEAILLYLWNYEFICTNKSTNVQNRLIDGKSILVTRKTNHFKYKIKHIKESLSINFKFTFNKYIMSIYDYINVFDYATSRISSLLIYVFTFSLSINMCRNVEVLPTLQRSPITKFKHNTYIVGVYTPHHCHC